MASIGARVKEIRIHCDNEYRVIYLAQKEKGIYVLHSFVKKTQKTSSKDLDLAKNVLNKYHNQLWDNYE